MKIRVNKWNIIVKNINKTNFKVTKPEYFIPLSTYKCPLKLYVILGTNQFIYISEVRFFLPCFSIHMHCQKKIYYLKLLYHESIMITGNDSMYIRNI